jgi:hypothetical protein
VLELRSHGFGIRVPCHDGSLVHARSIDATLPELRRNPTRSSLAVAVAVAVADFFRAPLFLI